MTRTRAGILGSIGIVVVAVLLVTWVGPNLGAAPNPTPAESPTGAAQAPPTPSPRAASPIAVASATPAATAGPPAIEGLVRVDQLGYLPDESRSPTS